VLFGVLKIVRDVRHLCSAGRCLAAGREVYRRPKTESRNARGRFLYPCLIALKGAPQRIDIAL
jgi:hypothetical protein